MIIPPKYFLTPQISKLLAEIEANKEVVDSIPVPIEIEQNLRRKSTLASSVFSARIEGNPTTLEDFAHLPSKDQKRVEVNNILRAINWIFERSGRDITVKDILNLHSITMKGIEYEELGRFRKKHEGVFAAGGVMIYHTPPPSHVPKLIDRLIKYANADRETFAPIRAVISHYAFEKIHPFADGNGRVGRLFLLMILAKSGYGFKGILPFEEMIDKRRETYYKMLEESERDITNYIEFMLETIRDASSATKKNILQKQEPQVADFLLPRRAEIYQIIKEQKLVNFDQIRRRFRDVNERTLRYDLKKLQDGGQIRKRGSTRGVYYEVI
ncbi:MAG TPA: Fic family protein [Patescibacteria group bacterium]|nr:Fic family protein [Patescibacteria group bacterium]